LVPASATGQLDLAYPRQVERLERDARADEALDEIVGGVGEDSLRRVLLGDPRTLAQNGGVVPIFIASSIPWVTKTIVFLISVCRAKTRSATVARDRIYRPEKLIYEHDRGSAAIIARATPMRCLWPLESGFAR